MESQSAAYAKLSIQSEGARKACDAVHQVLSAIKPLIEKNIADESKLTGESAALAVGYVGRAMTVAITKIAEVQSAYRNDITVKLGESNAFGNAAKRLRQQASVKRGLTRVREEQDAKRKKEKEKEKVVQVTKAKKRRSTKKGGKVAN